MDSFLRMRVLKEQEPCFQGVLRRGGFARRLRAGAATGEGTMVGCALYTHAVGGGGQTLGYRD